MLVIGLNGLMLAGKDTVGAYLVEAHGFERASFADKLKRGAEALFGVPLEVLEAAKSRPDAYLEWHGLDDKCAHRLTVREMYQRFGTEMGRETWGQSFWVDLATAGLSRDDDARYVFTDARFANELEAVRALGGETWQVIRDVEHREGIAGHASEVPPDPSLIDFKLDNTGRLGETWERIDARMARIEAIDRGEFA